MAECIDCNKKISIFQESKTYKDGKVCTSCHIKRIEGKKKEERKKLLLEQIDEKDIIDEEMGNDRLP